MAVLCTGSFTGHESRWLLLLARHRRKSDLLVHFTTIL